MKCPRCVQRIHRAAAICPHCGFWIGDADQRMGCDGLQLRRLTDQAGILRRGERERVEWAMERLSRRLPQVFVAVYTGALGELAQLRQFGFWLLNRGVFEDLPAATTNAAGILLTVDPEAKAAGMTFGYLLEPFLEEADTFECMARGHAHWLEQRYADGIVRVIEHLEGLLCKRSRQARRRPEAFARKVRPPQLTPGVRHEAAGEGEGQRVTEVVP